VTKEEFMRTILSQYIDIDDVDISGYTTFLGCPSWEYHNTRSLITLYKGGSIALNPTRNGSLSMRENLLYEIAYRMDKLYNNDTTQARMLHNDNLFELTYAIKSSEEGNKFGIMYRIHRLAENLPLDVKEDKERMDTYIDMLDDDKYRERWNKKFNECKQRYEVSDL